MKNQKDGEKRIKSTQVQLVRKLLKVAYRSSEVLLKGPVDAEKQKKKEHRKLQQQKGKICSGRYAILFQALDTLTWPAYKQIKSNLDEGARHTPVLGEFRVLSRYQPLSAPEKKYVHDIVEKDGRWHCIVDGEQCWQHVIRGIFCPHMCSLAQQTISGGGIFDIRIVTRSTKSRHRLSVQKQFKVPDLVKPVDLFKNIVPPNRNLSTQQITRSLGALYQLGGEKCLTSLHQLIQLKLLGGTTSAMAHKLVFKFMNSSRLHEYDVHTDQPSSPMDNMRYRNNEMSLSLRQERRIKNRGEKGAFSTGRSARKKEIIRKKMANVKLSGINNDVGSNFFTLKKAQSKGLLSSIHEVRHVTPIFFHTESKQRKLLEQFGFFTEKNIGLDLEYTGPMYPNRKKKSGAVYDASMLILTNFRATLLYHLYQYQDQNSDGIHWPGPYLPKFKNEKTGKWDAYPSGKGRHGAKWYMPRPVEDLLNREDLVVSGKNIRSDMTRLANVFLPKGTTYRVKPLEVTRITRLIDRKPVDTSLSSLLKLVTTWELNNKTKKRVRRCQWNSFKALEQYQVDYAACDGMASYILGRAYLRLKRLSLQAVVNHNKSTAKTTASSAVKSDNDTTTVTPVKSTTTSSTAKSDNDTTTVTPVKSTTTSSNVKSDNDTIIVTSVKSTTTSTAVKSDNDTTTVTPVKSTTTSTAVKSDNDTTTVTPVKSITTSSAVKSDNDTTTVTPVKSKQNDQEFSDDEELIELLDVLTPVLDDSSNPDPSHAAVLIESVESSQSKHVKSKAPGKSIASKRSKRLREQHRRLTFTRGNVNAHPRFNRCPICNVRVANMETVICVSCGWTISVNGDKLKAVEDDVAKKPKDLYKKFTTSATTNNHKVLDLPQDGDPIRIKTSKVI